MSAQDERYESNTLVAVDRTELAAWRKSWQEVLEAYEAIPCGTTEGFTEAQWIELRNQAHDNLAEREAERTSVTSPLNQELQAINRWYRESRAPAEAFKEMANRKLAAYATAQQEAAAAAQQRAQLAADAGDHEAAVEALAAIPNIEATAGNSVRFVWEVQVTDETELDRAFLSFDPKKAQAFADALPKGTTQYMLNGLYFKRVAKVQPTGKRK